MNEKVDRSYFILILMVMGWAVPITLAAVVYFWLFSKGIDLMWTTIPQTLFPNVDRRLYTVVVATFGGCLVGLTMHYLAHGHGKSLQEELAQEGRMEYRGLLGLLLGAIITLSCGASLGPEAPLAHLGGGMSTWLAERLKFTIEKTRIVAMSGVSAAFGALISSPVGSAFMTIEFTSLLTFPLYTMLIPALSASLVGFLVFSNIVGSPMVGLLRFEDYAGLRPVFLLDAVIFGALGLGLAFIFKLIHTGTRRLVEPLSKYPVLKTTIGGLGFGLVGAILPLSMFSGEHEIEEVINHGAEIGVVVLIVLAFVKLFTLSLCMNTGFPGGFIFPILFSAGTLGVAINLMVPTVPVSVAVVGLMAGVGGALMRMPISVILLISVLTQQELLPMVILATLTAYLLVMAVPAGDARQAYSDAEAEALTPEPA
ncbi:MAG TPA: chloride channel protein [Anaerolineae bacterium]|nr:chloride channel protein [Anaerolineae bacterium]MCB9108630.1 chloride channel protein [Anaerolineales bacterium]HRV93402.1 chloride channel protein [Anaerolineae bacterium]